MTYERAKVIQFKPPKKKERTLSIVPNPAFQVDMIDIVLRKRAANQNKTCISMSSNAADLLRSCWNPDTINLREEGKIIYLNRSNYVISVFEMSFGGITGTVMDPRHAIVAGLLQNATSMIPAHNHPSGNTKPSQADIELTKKLQFAANFHDMKVLDHIILTADGYLSMADEGYLP